MSDFVCPCNERRPNTPKHAFCPTLSVHLMMIDMSKVVCFICYIKSRYSSVVSKVKLEKYISRSILRITLVYQTKMFELKWIPSREKQVNRLANVWFQRDQSYSLSDLVSRIINIYNQNPFYANKLKIPFDIMLAEVIRPESGPIADPPLKPDSFFKTYWTHKWIYLHQIRKKSFSSKVQTNQASSDYQRQDTMNRFELQLLTSVHLIPGI